MRLPSSIFPLDFVTLSFLCNFFVLFAMLLDLLQLAVCTLDTQGGNTNASNILQPGFVLFSFCLLWCNVTLLQGLTSGVPLLDTLIDVMSSMYGCNSGQACRDQAFLLPFLHCFLFTGTGAEVRIGVCIRIACVMGLAVHLVRKGRSTSTRCTWANHGSGLRSRWGEGTYFSGISITSIRSVVIIVTVPSLLTT